MSTRARSAERERGQRPGRDSSVRATRSTINGPLVTGDHNKVTVKTVKRRRAALTVAVILAVAGVGTGGWKVYDAAAGSSGYSLVGTWAASDGSGTKAMDANGRCTGFYYANGVPLDIGGPMYCSLSEHGDSYLLTVTQQPNESSYRVEFTSADHAVVSAGGRRLYELDRAS
ncbi:hypothetical protein AB0I55_28430 [Actinocatenispora sera]|uniref:hypothetical protein n=1 Tax=Actinocatenispora sera TaxID=390989 RepID=UPI0033C0FCA1